ncbi:MAG: hypothetical protein IPK87_17185 [Planctomycetes bacterium]|nr:hypothetical protein [Planctomycetota bacterium]
MNGYAEIEMSLRDNDGSCRDINFLAPSWDGLAELLTELTQTFAVSSAEDHNGSVIAQVQSEALVGAARAGHVRMLLKSGNSLFKTLQVYSGAGRDGTPFIEMSFFPEDLIPTADLAPIFVQWVESMRTRVHASEYYVRYENASWRLGDIGPRSGVFCSSALPT